jgi:CBS domain-containing protein
MLVSHVLKEKGDSVVTVQDSAPLMAVATAMTERRIGALVVTDDRGAMTGVISEREVVTALARHQAGALRCHVRDIAVRAVTVAPGDSVRQAMAAMTEHRARHLLVLEDGRVVGLLSVGDVIKSRLSEKEVENQVLQDIARLKRAA